MSLESLENRIKVLEDIEEIKKLLQNPISLVIQ